MNFLINNEVVNINNKKYYGIREIFKKIDFSKINSYFVSPIHGDLNFENILYNLEKDDIKIIDMEGSRYVDTPMHDLGKLFQSLLVKYEEWSSLENIIYKINLNNNYTNNILCINKYFNYDESEILDVINSFKNILSENNEKKIIESGIFFMACYFIRFVPFRIKKNKEQGYFSLIMSIIWLNKLL